MEGNLDELKNRINVLNVEYSNKTAELLEKQNKIQVLNKQIFELDVHLQSLNTQKNSVVWVISNISREINNQQHRIARKKTVFASNNCFYYHTVISKHFHFQSQLIRLVKGRQCLFQMKFLRAQRLNGVMKHMMHAP